MSYVIQGQSVELDEEPREVEGQLYVPLAEIVQRLGGQTGWDNENKTATATIGKWTATIHMADPHVDVGGTAVTLAGDPIVDDDVMYVPATFFHDAFGYTVSTDAGSEQVSIALPG